MNGYGIIIIILYLTTCHLGAKARLNVNVKQITNTELIKNYDK